MPLPRKSWINELHVAQLITKDALSRGTTPKEAEQRRIDEVNVMMGYLKYCPNDTETLLTQFYDRAQNHILEHGPVNNAPETPVNDNTITTILQAAKKKEFGLDIDYAAFDIGHSK